MDAAWTVFAHKGWAATMADVAAAAKVSYGLAYRYFATKEALFHALVEESLRATEAGLASFPGRPGTPRERLEVLLTRLLDTRREHPEVPQLLAQALRDEATPPELRARAATVGQALHELFRHLIVAGQAAGEVYAADPDQLVTALLALLDGLARVASNDPERFHQHFPEPHIILHLLRPAAPQG